MFEPVTKKLARAEYFLSNIKNMASTSGGLPHVKSEDQNKVKADLDAFFFELVSAKDLFLQGINDHYAHLPRDEGTDLRKLKPCLIGDEKPLAVVKAIEKELCQRGTWLWILNNYRNAATHRELLPFHYVLIMDGTPGKAYLFKDPEDPDQGRADSEIIPYCERSLNEMKAFLDKLYSELHITS